MYTGWYLWVTLWKYYSNASKICQCESKADNLLCLVDWVGLYVWRLRNILLFFSSQYLCCIVCLEEKAKIRGGLELESFSIKLPRITTLWFLSPWLCAEVAVISSRVHVWLFSTLLQHPFIYLKVRPYPYINFFSLQLHTLPPQSTSSFKVGELPSKIKFAASDILWEIFCWECLPLDSSRTNQVCSPLCRAVSSWVPGWLGKVGERATRYWKKREYCLCLR